MGVDLRTRNKPPSVFIVVLNWNGWKDSIDCIKSIKQSAYPNINMVLVDNGSTDGSVEKIRGTYPDITILETSKNLGFAGGNNCGIRHALEQRAEYIFVLNNDTVVTSDCISKLIAFGEAHPEAALMGPKVCDVSTGEFLDLPMIRQVNLLTILLTKSPIKRLIDKTSIYRRFFYQGDIPDVVYAIHGSAMMFKASALREVGMFDEHTFIYWEEFIIAEKLKAKELLTYVVPDACLWHRGNASISKIGVNKFMENVKSEKYFFEKYLHLSPLSLWIVYSVRFIGYLGRLMIYKDYRENFSAFVRLLFSGTVKTPIP